MEEIQNKHYFEATGFSMWPFIQQDDRVIAEEVKAQDLQSGEVIIYRVEDKLVCHRLVSKKKAQEEYLFLARGDYVPSWKTEQVRECQLKGRICGVVHNGRLTSLKNWQQVFLGKIIVMFFPLPVFLFVRIRKIFRKA